MKRRLDKLHKFQQRLWLLDNKILRRSPLPDTHVLYDVNQDTMIVFCVDTVFSAFLFSFNDGFANSTLVWKYHHPVFSYPVKVFWIQNPFHMYKPNKKSKSTAILWSKKYKFPFFPFNFSLLIFIFVFCDARLLRDSTDVCCMTHHASLSVGLKTFH